MNKPAADIEDHFVLARRHMVEQQIAGRGVRDPRVLEAMQQIPRHFFMGKFQQELAYEDTPLPIDCEQTISQPYMVGLMSEMLQLRGDERVLEVGTGSGYQTAILAKLAALVFTVEYRPALAERAKATWDRLGLTNIQSRVGDGTLGWREEAPFQAILVTAGAPNVPPPLLEQLAMGGRLVIPAGDRFIQALLRLVKQPDGSLRREEGVACRFVPLTGVHGWSAAQ